MVKGRVRRAGRCDASAPMSVLAQTDVSADRDRDRLDLRSRPNVVVGSVAANQSFRGFAMYARIVAIAFDFALSTFLTRQCRPSAFTWRLC